MYVSCGYLENAACRRPYRQNLDLSGTRAVNLAGNDPWRTQDLSLPMSPIEQPSALQLMESSLYDELPIDQKVNAPLLPNALKHHHSTGQPNLPPPRATSTVVRDSSHKRQEHTVPPFSSPLAGGRADLSTSRLSTEAVLPRKRQLAVRHGSSGSVSKVPSLPCNAFVSHSEHSAVRICLEQQQYPFKKLAPQKVRSACTSTIGPAWVANASRYSWQSTKIRCSSSLQYLWIRLQQCRLPYLPNPM